MNFFDHKNLGNHLLQLCPKVVKRPVYVTIFVSSRFRTNLLVANHLIIFDTEQKSLKFLLEIMTLVSSTINIGSDIGFILRGRSFINIMNNRGHKIDLW